MRVIRLLGCLGVAGVAACAGHKEEQQAQNETQQAAAAAATVPASEVQATEVQPVAGEKAKKELAPGETLMKEQGIERRETGRFTQERGEWFAPQGVYGTKGKYGVSGKEGVKGTYGTYFRAEEKFQEPESVFVNPEGTYIDPFGEEGPTAGSPAGMHEKQPVAGRLTGEMLLITDDQGRTIAVKDPKLVQALEEKLVAAKLLAAADSMMDKDTSLAIVKFQKEKGLTASGALDHKTADALGLDWQVVVIQFNKVQQPQPSK